MNGALTRSLPKHRLHADVPFSGWLALVIVPILLWLRQWPQLIFLFFYTSTSATALLVHSGWNIVYASSYHLVLFAILTCWLANAVHAAWLAGVSTTRGVNP
jgi:hypothetical protein